MDCEACTDHLVELLYEELPDDEAERTRAHLDGCPTCAEAFDRIRVGQDFASMLELAEPPVSVLDAVMAAAREKAADRLPASEPATEEHATAPRTEAAADDDGVWAGFLKFIGGFAMRPQLAMAMTLLLIVGLGMWYLPTLRQNDPADSHSIVSPDPTGEVGPSAQLEPAEPLDLEANPQTGRILPRDAEEGAAGGERVAARPRPEAEPDAPAPPTEPTEAAEDVAPALAEAPADAPPGEVIAEALPDPRVDQFEQDLAPGETSGATPAPTTSAPAGPRPSAPAMAAEAETAPMPPPATEQQQGQAPSDRYARGLQRFRERNYRGAADDFESVVERPGPGSANLVPSALDRLAQSQARAGNCGGAVRSWQRLLREHPRYAGTGDAMLGLAGCYRRMGRLGDARQVLERARSVPSVSADARRQLADIAARERAAEAVAEPTSE